MIELSRPRSLAELIKAYGGVADTEAYTRILTCVRSAWSTREDGDDDSTCLVPVLRPRALAAACARTGVLLIDAALAPHAPIGRRWVHSHAPWVLACLLSESENESEQESAIPPLQSPLAYVEEGALVDPNARLDPFCVIHRGVVVGARSWVGSHAVLYPRVTVGNQVIIGAHAVLGRPGFGWATGPEGQVCRVPQRAGVVVEDDAEIGALATVDAGTLSPTIIGRAARLDAHVHVGHNVVIGPGTLVAAQSGFAGSVRLGAGVHVGGQVGVADYVVVGDNARLAAKAGVIGNIPAGSTVAGYPAVEKGRWLRGIAQVFGRHRRGKTL